MGSIAKQHFSARQELQSFNLLTTPIWIFDVERHGMWWANRHALRFWRAENLEELLARDFGSDSQTVRQRLAQVIAKTPPGEVAAETWTLYPDNMPVTVLLAITPISIEGGRDAVLIESSAPLDLQSNDEALRLLEATRYTSLMVTTYTLEGQLLSRNPAAIDTFGQMEAGGQTQANGQTGTSKTDARQANSDLDRHLGEPHAAAALRQNVARGHPFARDLKVHTAQGPRWHQIQAQRGRDPRSGEWVIVVTETDITGRVQAEARLASLNSELEKRVRQRTAALERSNEEAIEARNEAEYANRTKSKFLANMSHELRTPLNAILGFSDIIRLGVFGRVNERYLEYVTDINASALHLLGLIDGLLDLAKIEAGKMVLQESEMDLRALLNETLQMVAATNQGSGKEMTLACPLPEVPLLADSRLMKQVALNLLSNAAKFTPENGRVTVDVRFDGPGDPGGDCGLEVRFTDNGIGIDSDKLDLVFRPYEHNASFVGGVKSTGLGLPIARSFVELHGGSLHLESALGEGTTAVLRLPAVRVLAPSRPMPGEPGHSEAAFGAGRRAAES